MNQETKTHSTGSVRACQNCKQNFTIEPEDFQFYERIQVPPPTWCPECRLVRKMSRRNERTLYKRQCDLCNAEMISMYARENPFTIYCNSCWWSDKWGPFEYGRDYDFSKSFFQQFHDLSREVPRMALHQKNPVNSPYTNHSDHVKNCYLAFDSGFVEDSMYCKWIVQSKEVLDAYGLLSVEMMYESQDCKRCARGSFIYFCEDCIDSSFLWDCRGCQNCFLSSNLRNKKYYFANQQLSKEEYQKRIATLNLGNNKVLEEIKRRFFNEILPATVRKYAILHKVVNSTGNNLYESKNLKKCFHVYESEDSAYCVDAANLKDCYDAYEPAFNCELQYECHACNRVTHSKFSSISYDNHHIDYSEICHNSSYLFGCVGLRNKQYCILNKQYTKESFDKLRTRIIEHMNTMPYVDKMGRVYQYGEFFPPDLSPFAYNETIAQEYFPLTKEQAIKQGYRWKEPEPRNYEIHLKPEDLADHIKDVGDDILGKNIQCAHITNPPAGGCNEQCTQAFKIIKEELQFYRKMSALGGSASGGNLPLPRLCPNCRHYQRLKQRNPLKLWHRRCQCAGSTNSPQAGSKYTYQNTAQHFHQNNPCPNEFETSYAPERSEIVYCESCYNSEVV